MVEHARIVARRVELGISQAELARRVGISQPAIVEIEKGRVQSTRYVNEIARALDLQPYEIDPKFGR
ncbi:helix-turn-helix transcriptional regulator, partial [Proteus mirabilis]